MHSTLVSSASIDAAAVCDRCNSSHSSVHGYPGPAISGRWMPRGPQGQPPASPGPRVLVVDPNIERAAHLATDLDRYEIRSALAASAIEALHRYGEADVVLLDLDLPGEAGYDLCRSLVALSDVPIIAMTARPAEVNRVLGLQAGADDCVVRPVGPNELQARIAAVLRRYRPDAAMTRAGAGELTLDPLERRVRVGDAEVELSRKEFDMLHMLVRARGGVVSRSSLLREVWEGSYSRRTIDTHVNSVRNKLGDAAWIETVRGVGYRMGRP